MEALFAYSLSLFLFFYLLNYADITAIYAKSLKEQLGPIWGYPLGCAMCWGFWMTLLACLMGVVPGWFVFTAPVVHLFIDLGYSRLSCDNTNRTYQVWRADELEKPLP